MYKVIITQSANKELQSLQKHEVKKLYKVIESLSENPRLPALKN